MKFLFIFFLAALPSMAQAAATAAPNWVEVRGADASQVQAAIDLALNPDGFRDCLFDGFDLNQNGHGVNLYFVLKQAALFEQTNASQPLFWAQDQTADTEINIYLTTNPDRTAITELSVQHNTVKIKNAGTIDHPDFQEERISDWSMDCHSK